MAVAIGKLFQDAPKHVLDSAIERLMKEIQVVDVEQLHYQELIPLIHNIGLVSQLISVHSEPVLQSMSPGLRSRVRSILIAHQGNIPAMHHLADMCAANAAVFPDIFEKETFVIAADAVHILAWLAFLKIQLSRESANMSNGLDGLSTLLQLSTDVSPENGPTELSDQVQLLAMDVLLLALQALATYHKRENLRIKEKEQIDLAASLWKACTTAATESGIDARRLKLWIRILSLPPSFRLPMRIFQSQVYWKCIQDGLRTRAPEKQKLYLYLLRSSMEALDEDVYTDTFYFPIEHRETALREYERYCSVYAAVVIGRYSNQVEEILKAGLPLGCLHGHSTEENFMIPGSWWTTLCIGALTQTNTESISKMVGKWILGQRFPVVKFSKDFTMFIAHHLVPWASQGHLFNRSIVRRGTKVRCEHGSSLSNFLSSLLQNADTYQTSSAYARAILQGLLKCVPRVNPHAVGYVLQGLDPRNSDRTEILYTSYSYVPAKDMKGDISRTETSESNLVSRPKIESMCYESDIAALIMQIMNQVPLTHAQRTICDYFARSIIGSSSSGSRNAVNTEPYEAEEPADQDTILGGREPLFIRLQSILKQHGNCKGSHGLMEACNAVAEALQTKVVDIPQPSIGEAFHTLFSAIWRETEMLGLPRAVLVRLPALYYDKLPIMSSAEHTELKAFLSQRLLEFLKLSQTKIYIWNPLTEAVRYAYFDIPNFTDLLPLEDFLVTFASKPPSPTNVFLLDNALSQGIGHGEKQDGLKQFADEGRGHACIFDLMNRLREDDKPLGKAVMDRLLQPWLSERNLSSIAFTSDWKDISMLQTMLILAHGRFKVHGLDSIDYTATETFRNHLYTILRVEPKPDFRFLLEWMIMACYMLYPQDMRRSGEEILQRLKDATNGNAIPRYVVSLLKIGLMTAPYTSNVGLFTSSEFPAQFTAMVAALCAHDKVAIRFEALWTFPRLIDIAHQFQLLQSETDLESRSEWEKIYNNPAYSHLNGVIRSLAKYKNPPTTRALEKFDPSNDQNLGMLFEGGYLQLDTSGAVDNCTVAVEHFEMIYRKDEEVMETRALDRPDLNMARGRSQPKPSQHIQKKPKKCAPGSATTTPQVFQSKSLTLVEKKTQAIKAAEMILIATFVDSPYNLGGLSRVAEIFGCSALHISDLGVLKDSAFTSVSVTSESNLNIVQTPPPILKGFLRSKRAEGWTILGVEQTDSSIVLGDEKAPKLPKKVVIVMGTEKTGIPPDVLVECDSCVEIKQWGLTRSLNVQTAAAAVLYEWRREWGDGL